MNLTSAIGRAIARRIFRKRGNRSEIHLSELELAVLIGLGAGLAMKPKRERDRWLQRELAQ